MGAAGPRPSRGDGWRHVIIISKWTHDQITSLSRATTTLPFTRSPVLNTGESFPSLSAVYCGHFPLLTAHGVPRIVSPSLLRGIVLVVPFPCPWYTTDSVSP